MRRAFAALRQGRPGPVLVEIPSDVALGEVDESAAAYTALKPLPFPGNPQDIEAAAQALCSASAPVIHAGQGVLYAGASDELLELAELLQVPVMSSLAGKSVFPETHPLALGSASGVMSGPVYQFMRRADLVLGIGCSFTKHVRYINIPAGKTIIQITNDPRDLNKDYQVDIPIMADAKLALRQLIDACRDIVGDSRQAYCHHCRGHSVRAGNLAGPVDAQADQQPAAHQSLPGHLGLYAGHPTGRRHRYPRFGQSEG